MFRMALRRRCAASGTEAASNVSKLRKVSRSELSQLLRIGARDETRIMDDLAPALVIESVRTELPGLAPEYLLSHHARRMCEDDFNSVTLLAIDNLPQVTYSNLLLRLGEYAARNSSNVEYGLLDACVRRSAQLIASFTPGELIGLISLCARLDFVDSDFNEAVQTHIPSVLTQFKDNQYPILFASIFRLGIDQPVDRDIFTDSLAPKTLPFMLDLITEIIRRLPNIPESGCLTMLHSILRKPRSRITPETLQLVHAISDQAQVGTWPLHMRVQVMHSLSRFGVENKPAIEALFSSITRESILSIPPQNLQHLLSIIHNHAQFHEKSIWVPALDVCLDRLSQPVIAKTMPMAIIAVTISYLGRLSPSDSTHHLRRGFGNLLNAFMTGNSKLSKNLDPSIEGRITEKSVRRILTDSLVDIAHLTGIVEAIDRLGYWDMYYAVPLVHITRRFMLRDGIHNIRAAPLCQLSIAILNGGLGELTRDEFRAIDKLIDSHIESVSSVGTNWSLINEAIVAPSHNETIALLLEGLLKHEAYIRTTQSVLDRCVKIRAFEAVRKNEYIPEKILLFLDSLPEKAEQVIDTS